MMRQKLAILVALAQMNCSLIGATVGGVSAAVHNSGQHEPPPSGPHFVEAPACALHRRALEVAASSEPLPNCLVPAPDEASHDRSTHRNVAGWAARGFFLGLAVDLTLFGIAYLSVLGR